MEDQTYSVLRQFADSWGMLAMFTGFLAIVAWVLLGKRSSYHDAANSIFRNEDAPAEDSDETPPGERGEEHRI